MTSAFFWGPLDPVCVVAPSTANGVYCRGETATEAMASLRALYRACRLAGGVDDTGGAGCSIAQYAVPMQSDGSVAPIDAATARATIVPLDLGAPPPPRPTDVYSLVNATTTLPAPAHVLLKAAGPQCPMPARSLVGPALSVCLVPT